MTPRDQIQEQAEIAAKKVRQAMAEFATATGMCATVDISWVRMQYIESGRPINIVRDVLIRFSDEAMA